jgi:hypothetical protein
MRHDNDVTGMRRGLRAHVQHFVRAHLNTTTRRTAALGLAAAIGTSGLALTHTPADPATAGAATTVTQTLTAATHDTSHDTKATSAEATAAKAAQTKAMPAAAPVAGLDATQMKNAALIVKAGQDLGISQRGQIVAVATAMQESNLYNRASHVVPESLNYAHQGTGADYDSVGLFQQRYTTGWGTVKTIMNPTESAKSFYKALQHVDGWQNMPVTVAAQTVQGSAFPDAYAKHQDNATQVVHTLNNTH